MEVKKAIEFMNNEIKREIIYSKGILVGAKESPRDKKIDEIISLLQQGEKYRQMWEELEKYRQMWEELDEFIGYSDYDILQVMERLKQKYFPKEEKGDGS